MKTSIPCHGLCLLLATSLVAGCPGFRTESRTRRVRIETQPPGAAVWYQDASGQHALGTSPVTLEREVPAQVYEFNPWTWVWAGLMGGMTAGGGVWLASTPESDDLQQGLSIAMLLVGGIGFLVATPAAIFGQLEDGRETITPQSFDIGAELPGHAGARMQIELPSAQEQVSLLLHPTEQPGPRLAAVYGSADLLAPQDADRLPPVVAVFDVHDAAGRLTAAEREQLTAYLATCLTQAHKARVVPREQLRARLLAEKKVSYRSCYQESCQIELGRAVAAEKSLAATVLRVGKRCAVTVNLYDLKSETSERAATEQSGCAVEDLMGAMQKVAERL